MNVLAQDLLTRSGTSHDTHPTQCTSLVHCSPRVSTEAILGDPRYQLEVYSHKPSAWLSPSARLTRLVCRSTLPLTGLEHLHDSYIFIFTCTHNRHSQHHRGNFSHMFAQTAEHHIHTHTYHRTWLHMSWI